MEAFARAHDAIARGQAIDGASAVERGLLDALTARYPDDPGIEDCTPWTEAFARRMDAVRAAHGHDLDVLAFWAEAQMNRTPWALWDIRSGRPADGASTPIVRERLEKAFADRPEAWDHPGLLHMDFHVRVRFGEWQSILEQPMPDDPELYCHSHALQRHARTVALANLGRIDEARRELAAYHEARDIVANATRFLFNNEAKDNLCVATAMGEGELAYKSGDVERGLECLRGAVAASDGLVYDEPWGWMQPPRHALAALLMDQGRHDEAEPIYRADLGLDASLPRPHHHPDNVWSLQGLEECLRLRGETVEHGHVRAAFERARARADVPIRASCFCRAAGG